MDDRIYNTDLSHWYFKSRGHRINGPYDTRLEAEAALSHLTRKWSPKDKSKRTSVKSGKSRLIGAFSAKWLNRSVSRQA